VKKKSEVASQMPDSTVKDDPSSSQAFTLTNVLASGSSLFKSDAPATALSGAAASVASSPCLRTALLWGSAVSLLLGAHRFRNGGTALKAANDAALGWMFTVGLQWTLCRRDEHDKRLALRAFYQNRQQMAQSPNAAHEALLGVSKYSENSTNAKSENDGINIGNGNREGCEFTNVSIENLSPSSTIEVTDEEIKREVDRLTSYGTLSRVIATNEAAAEKEEKRAAEKVEKLE